MKEASIFYVKTSETTDQTLFLHIEPAPENFKNAWTKSGQKMTINQKSIRPKLTLSDVYLSARNSAPMTHEIPIRSAYKISLFYTTINSLSKKPL